MRHYHNCRLIIWRTLLHRPAVPVTKATLSLGAYELALTLPAPTPSTKSFLKAIPDLVSFCQAWAIYMALRVAASPDCTLGPALAGFLMHIAELDQHFDWTYIVDYILMVCKKWFGHADADTWSRQDMEAFQDKLAIAPTKSLKPLVAPAEQRKAGTNATVCLCWNNSTCTGPSPSGLLPIHLVPVGSPSGHPPRTSLELSPPVSPAPWQPLMDTPTPQPPCPIATPPLEGPFTTHQPIMAAPLAGRPATTSGPPAMATKPITAPTPLTAPAPIMATPPLMVPWPITAPRLIMPPPPPPPASAIFSLPAADLCLHLLLQALCRIPAAHPNTTIAAPIFTRDNVPACWGSMQECTHAWWRLLACYPDAKVCHQLLGGITHGGRLTRVTDPTPLICSPIGMVPKPHSSGFHTIHHLSHPCCPGSKLPSVNASIQLAFVSLWLLGFTFDGMSYHENALTFGGKSSSWLFNLYAKMVHWIVSSCLPPGLPLNHYLDDFFGAVPAGGDSSRPVCLLALTCKALGLDLSPSKTFFSSKKLEVLGIEINTEALTIGITDMRRSSILRTIQDLLQSSQVSLLQLQRISSLLQFVTQVAPVMGLDAQEAGGSLVHMEGAQVSKI
ncbi:uncharacterized protein UHO2_06889 [Ustilago hordei]|uniref:uncharacterized protein n=1 Tax=Ustilago hordei TaxID=120017 RepID=UPI001A4F09A8|nr:uncharacterized protein UHO2_06889 [Ustilago hordei]SYW83693.1 uncharacterized protein UHO2_06889 [Ustilago hordei]